MRGTTVNEQPDAVTAASAVLAAHAGDQACGLLEWVLREGRLLPTGREFIGALAARLREAGVPVDRATVNLKALHPQLLAYSYYWQHDEGPAVEESVERTEAIDRLYRASPFYRIYEHGETIRRRLTGPDARIDFPILEDLVAEGYTDYYCVPLPFVRGEPQAATWATKRPGGFSDDCVATIEALMPVLGLVFELYAARRLTATLLDTYLGHRTGEQVLQGRIRRGDGETISAVLWYCDIRGFTAVSEHQPRDAVIDMLNDFFGCVGSAVERHGGEVVKFVGDGMLAIFPVDGAGCADRVAEALDAAVAAIEALRAVQERRDQAGEPPFGFGIALHLGEVMYGNIGSPTRLDFTVIGPAVNLAVRLEEVNKALGLPLIVSAALAAHAPHPLLPLGRFRLRGLSQEQEGFTLPALAPELASPADPRHHAAVDRDGLASDPVAGA
ncbi:MAG: adenylate/guanylate cyclase domain-containing protein [Alphaproteobacteria bacterium]